ncbi:MAG: GlsB/YeaQ/YmgE family stress response membrane protein [Pseudonocardia sp.]
MTVTGIITAIVIGLILGVLARLILPGKQNIPIWLTILVGIVAAILGTFLASYITTSGFLTFIIQLILAVIGVGLVAGTFGRGRART